MANPIGTDFGGMNAWRCSDCGAIMSAKGKDEHLVTGHCPYRDGKYKCVACGYEGQPDAMREHWDAVGYPRPIGRHSEYHHSGDALAAANADERAIRETLKLILVNRVARALRAIGRTNVKTLEAASLIEQLKVAGVELSLTDGRK